MQNSSSQIESTSESAADAILLLSGKWTVPLLLALCTKPHRISELVRAIPGSTKKMLIESLHRLERAGIVRRIDLSLKVRHVEYGLVIGSCGSLEKLLKDLGMWHDEVRNGQSSERMSL